MRNHALKLAQNDDWTPRALPGGKYCSPACGGAKGFCTRRAFDLATKAATDLAARLGDGWQPRVWENLGWHWEVANGGVNADRFDGSGVVVRLHSHNGRYWAEFRSAPIRETATQFFAEADTPEEAVGLVRQDVRTFITRLEADLAETI